MKAALKTLAAFSVLFGSVWARPGFADEPKADPETDQSQQPGSGSSCAPIGWTLRLDFNSINTNICNNSSPDYLPYQEGAQATLTIDKLAHTHSVSGDGVVAGYANLFGNNSTFLGLVLGPYLQADGAYQFGTSTIPLKRSGTLTEGGFAQIGFATGTVENYFRFRGGESESSSGINSTTLVGEWLPTFKAGPPDCRFGFNVHVQLSCGGIGTTYFLYSLTPELMVQSDHLDDGPNKFVLFSNHDSALRVGPQIGLALRPYCEAINNSDHCDDDTPGSFWGKFTLSAIYHVSEDTISNRNYAWILTTLTFNATDNIGLTASYGAGSSEATANTTSQIKIGLSAKF